MVSEYSRNKGTPQKTAHIRSKGNVCYCKLHSDTKYIAPVSSDIDKVKIEYVLCWS